MPKTLNPSIENKINGLFFILLGLSSLTFIVFSSSLYLGVFYQGVLGWGMVFFLWAAKRMPLLEEPPGRIFYLAAGTFITLRYWIFRTFDSLVFLNIPDVVGMMVLYLAESYGILIYLLGIFICVWPLRRKKAPLPGHPELYPTVDIFIPTYNEPVEIVKITALACTQLDYPQKKLTIYILDDGATLQKRQDPDPEKAVAAWRRYHDLRSFAQSHGMVYLSRERNVHAKAGNINAALSFGDRLSQVGMEQTIERLKKERILWGDFTAGAGELILFLDCDHAPTKDFLKNTVGYFLEDEKLFLVQTPHFFINPTPVEKNLETPSHSPGENEMFYGAIQLGLDFWNASFFCGSAALMRRAHLKEIGGIQRDSITEDAETSLILHSRGYRSAYLARPMICGLSPETFDDFIVQRSRWTQGMIQIFLLKNPLFMRGLNLAQRLCYTNSCLFWFFGLARMVFFIAPLLYLLLGIRVYNASELQVLVYTVPHILASLIVTDYLYGKVRHPFFSELYEAVQSVFLVPAIIGTLLNPRAPRFRVTPKGKNLEGDFLSPLAGPFYILFLLSIAGMIAGAWRWIAYPEEQFSIFICLFWLAFNFILVMLCLGIVWESRQRRRYYRIWAEGRVEMTFPGKKGVVTGEIQDVSLGGFNIASKEDLSPQKGEEVEIRGIDGYGNPYFFGAQIARVQRKDGVLHLGVRLIIPDMETFSRIIGFVYGDSERWSRFWHLRQRHRVSVPRGLYDLLKMGIEGTAKNFRGILPMVLRTFQVYARGIWTGFRWPMANIRAAG